MTRPTIAVQAAFATTPLTQTTNGSWTTLDKVDALSCSHGRQQRTEAFQPGQLAVTLDNTDRRFDPEHSAGAHYGSLLPRKRLRATATWGAHLDLPGSTGDYASTPDHADFDIVGDIECWARIALDDWTPSGANTVLAKFETTTDLSWFFGVNTGGYPIMGWSTDGTLGGLLTAVSTEVVPAADGDIVWLRWVLDVDDGGGNRVATFYYSTDDTHDYTKVTWTELDEVTTAGSTSINSDTDAVSIGATNTGFGNIMAGQVYGVALWDGFSTGGPPVFACELTNGNLHSGGDTTFDDLIAAKTVTVAGNAALVGEEYALAGGFVERWPQSYGAPFAGGAASVTIPATDAFRLLAQQLEGSPLELEIAKDRPPHWWKLAEDQGSPVIEDSGVLSSDGVTRGEGVPGLGSTGLDPGSDATCWESDGTDAGYLETTVAATYGGSRVGTAFFLTRVDTDGPWLLGVFPPGNGIDKIAVLANGRLAAELGGTGGTQEAVFDIADGATHDVWVVQGGGVNPDPRIFIDGTEQTTNGASLTDVYQRTVTWGSRPGSSLGFDGKLQHLVLVPANTTTDVDADTRAAAYNEARLAWTGDTTGERIGRILDVVGWPAGERDIDTGKTTLGPAATSGQDALTYMQRVEASEAGWFWQDPDFTLRFRDRYTWFEDFRSAVVQWAFTDQADTATSLHFDADGLEFDGFDEDQVVNEVTVSWVDGDTTVRDDDSIDAYGRRPLSVDTVLPTAAQARSLGEWILGFRAEPATRVRSLTFDPASDDRLWRAALDVRIGDRVSVTFHPQETGTATTVNALVEGIERRTAGKGDGPFPVTLTLSTVETADINWFTWGKSGSGWGQGRWAY